MKPVFNHFSLAGKVVNASVGRSKKEHKIEFARIKLAVPMLSSFKRHYLTVFAFHNGVEYCKNYIQSADYICVTGHLRSYEARPIGEYPRQQEGRMAGVPADQNWNIVLTVESICPIYRGIAPHPAIHKPCFIEQTRSKPAKECYSPSITQKEDVSGRF